METRGHQIPWTRVTSDSGLGTEVSFLQELEITLAVLECTT